VRYDYEKKKGGAAWLKLPRAIFDNNPDSCAVRLREIIIKCPAPGLDLSQADLLMSGVTEFFPEF
jgi:hypothetical protein